MRMIIKMTQKKPVIYRDDDIIELPTKWAICHACEGEGKSSAYLGEFTEERMDEMDDEFIEDYIEGRFDRPCDCCGGSGKIKEVDLAMMSPDDIKLYQEQEAERRADEREHAMELRMGA